MATAYTHRNLKELDDSAVEHGLSPKLEARFGRKALESERSGLSYQKLAPNFSQPFGHRHGDQEETYVIVSGGGRMKVGDELIDVKQWDAIRVAPQTLRAFEAGDDGLEFLAFGAGEPGEAEMVSDPWEDGDSG
jgi:mannose-6-phosphate isomerase-like protein (cupin superfamily)